MQHPNCLNSLLKDTCTSSLEWFTAEALTTYLQKSPLDITAHEIASYSYGYSSFRATWCIIAATSY